MQRIRVVLRDTHFVLNDRSPSQITWWITVRWRECKGERARPHIFPLLHISPQRRHSFRRRRMVGHWRNCHWSVSYSTLFSIHIVAFAVESASSRMCWLTKSATHWACSTRGSLTLWCLLTINEFPSIESVWTSMIDAASIGITVVSSPFVTWPFSAEWLTTPCSWSFELLSVCLADVRDRSHSQQIRNDVRFRFVFPLHFLCKMTYSISAHVMRSTSSRNIHTTKRLLKSESIEAFNSNG